MAIFVIQGRYSESAIKGMLDNPEDRTAAAAKLAEAAGGKLVAYYVLFGEHDFMVIVDMPGPKEAAAVALAAAGAGGVTNTKTTLAMTAAEAKAAFQAGKAAAAGYRRPGAA